MTFSNCYDDDAYAAAYAKLEFPGTYYLAFRDLPDLFKRHAQGKRAMDFGCGTGRSTRFLVKHGFETIGVEIANEMVRRAKNIDPSGNYHLIEDGQFDRFPNGSFDLILSAFTFDNIPTLTQKLGIFKELRRLLPDTGRLVNLVSSPEMYLNEWLSFSTKDFPENRDAQSGDEVRIIVTALDDHRPAVDVLCPDETYRKVYDDAGLTVVELHRPIGHVDEPFDWITEHKTPPWSIYVLGPKTNSGNP